MSQTFRATHPGVAPFRCRSNHPGGATGELRRHAVEGLHVLLVGPGRGLAPVLQKKKKQRKTLEKNSKPLFVPIVSGWGAAAVQTCPTAGGGSWPAPGSSR